MSYHVYTTLGFILEGKPADDADKYYYIFTKELGLVIASAKSVRKNESKLRPSLDDSSLSELSFVRGKQRWKIISAREVSHIYRTFLSDHAKRDVAMRILDLLKKLLQGEEKNESLFQIVYDAILFLEQTKMSREELVSFEHIATLRILTNLGYVKGSDEYSSFIETNVWSKAILHDGTLFTKQMVKDINASIEASQL